MAAIDIGRPAVASDGRASGLAGGRGAAAGAADREELKRLAQEFEATLLNEMLAGWRRSLMDEEEESGDTGGAFADMVGSEFGRAMSRAGGLGIADVLMRALQREYGRAPGAAPDAATASQPAGATSRVLEFAGTSVSAAARHVPAVSAGRWTSGISAADAATPDSARAVPAGALGSGGEAVGRPGGVVTSGFGWRADPIDGRARFHAGADIRMAYGQEVATVAPGRVTFAGDRGGYGLTVVVDHGEGLETRYAHLSSTSVGVGDVVGGGDVIARSGSSGRSTGPHLHIELLRDGRRVDPSNLVAVLKSRRPDADFPAYRSVSVLGTAMVSDGRQE
jgi:murein DD-endopeptidase MepM/ murein hydrolase activator NlpD